MGSPSSSATRLLPRASSARQALGSFTISSQTKRHWLCKGYGATAQSSWGSRTCRSCMGKPRSITNRSLFSNQTGHGFSPLLGYTHNPYNRTGEMGGSNSGAAAAVAANLAMGAVGVETDGSLVAPSSATAVVGFKPTFSKDLLREVVPFAPSIDTVSYFCHALTVRWAFSRAPSLTVLQSRQQSRHRPTTAVSGQFR